jgi:hypothetical protein
VRIRATPETMKMYAKTLCNPQEAASNIPSSPACCRRPLQDVCSMLNSVQYVAKFNFVGCKKTHFVSRHGFTSEAQKPPNGSASFSLRNPHVASSCVMRLVHIPIVNLYMHMKIRGQLFASYFACGPASGSSTWTASAGRHSSDAAARNVAPYLHFCPLVKIMRRSVHSFGKKTVTK